MKTLLAIVLCTKSMMLLPVVHVSAQALEFTGNPVKLETNSQAETQPANQIREHRLYATTNADNTVIFTNEKQTPTIFLNLSQPLHNHAGQELISADVGIEATLQKTDGGVVISAQYLLIDGFEIPVKATSHEIFVQDQIVESRVHQAAQIMQWTRPVASVVSEFAGDHESRVEGAVGIMPGMLSSIFVKPKRQQSIFLPQNQIFPLRLAAPIDLPDYIAQALGKKLEPSIDVTSQELVELAKN